MAKPNRYGAAHRAMRAQWDPLVAAGRVACARCSLPILPTDAWDLGHTDGGTDYHGPEHARCNRAAAGRRLGTSSDPRPSPPQRW